MPYSFVLSGLKAVNQTPWNELKPHCLWENSSLVLQLAFFGILLIYLARKLVLSMCKNRLIEASEIQTNNKNNKKTVLIILSSALLLGVHLILLSLTLKNHQSDQNQCLSSSFILVLATESLQVVSWAITMISPCRIQAQNFVILKIWWICNFLLSFINSSFLAKRVIDTRKLHLNVHDYTDIVALLASTFLVIVSIRTTTNLSKKAKYDLLTDPLLEQEQEQETERESLYGKATLTELITFSWMNPLFALGKKNALEEGQIPNLDVQDSSSFVSKSFLESLKKVKSEQGSENPSIYKVIYLFGRKKAAINAVFAVISAVASYVGPYLVNDFVDFLSDKKNRSNTTGYLIVLGFFLAKVVETTAQRQWVFGARQLGVRLRAALVSHIYQKGLVLSTQSRQSHTSGEIINYMSVDVQRITDFSWYLNIVAMLPIQISLAIYVLHTNLGLGSIAGFLATVIVMSCNIPLTRTQKKYQSRIMESKDDRMKSTSEVLRNIKAIKLQAWDDQFLKKLERLRKVEYNWLWKSLRLGAVGAFIFWGSPTFISVVTFGSCVLLGINLTAGRVLSALATFRMLQDPIFSLPDLLNVVAQAKVSADRLASYLQEDEIQKHSIEFIPKSETPYSIEIENGQFTWDPLSRSLPTLDGINLRVERGMKVAICGSVGSGKSSLLSALIGEIQKVNGGVKISGSKAYVPQTPWILTGNVRENILFGSEFDAVKYGNTVKACALEKDFELFNCGDLTEIGERGINMSGGQKQRIQIARAVYQDADIYLLDDPFSAVDAHTGSQLFQECLMGMLKDKSIIYVTHQVEFLPAADLILVMKDGRIAQAGTFNELLSQNTGFEILVGAHNDALESIVTMEASSRASQNMELKQDLEQSTEPQEQQEEEEEEKEEEITSKKGIIQEEERVKGSIDSHVYWYYLTSVKHGLLVPLVVLAQSSFQVLQIASNYYIAWACPTTTDGDQPIKGMDHILLIYMILSVLSSVCVLFRAIGVATHGLLASQKLFQDLLCCILRAPMSFFDSTPTGRILNRVSSDQSVLDLEIPNRLGWAAFSTIQLIGTIAVMSQVAWEVFVIFIPVTAICIWYKQYYIPTARELARLTEIQKAPVLHHFAESLTGAATIRAFGQKTRFVDSNLVLIDNFSRPFFHNVSAMEWLSYRLNQLSNFVFAFSLVLLVSLPDGIINPSIAGLAVTYGINLNVLQASVIWNICNAENKMISVERIMQYSKLESEAPLIIQDSRPTKNWPALGSIHFQNLQIRYAEHLPAVLKNITCTFPGRKKIGVVGRTGSGKSTLIQAIFRIVEPSEGSIIIDNVDICKIGLHDLRSRLSIIPQDPTMFDGTVRGNLDPLEQHSDAEIWEALEKCQLIDIVNAKEGKLDTTVVENGENWSVGQRQLFCLGRALLKQSSILILDEATASVDSATDGVIQRIINQEFKDKTIVTIAHRIHTVIDSDLVLVLSDGKWLCAQDGIRMPWNVIPGTKQELANCVIPVSAIYTPLKPLSSNPPVLPYQPLRCRTCRSLLNPFSVVDFAAKIWICPFCFTRNHFPSHYNSIAEDNLPAELFPQYTTIEYEPPVTQTSHSPPPVFLFVVDTCLIEEELGFLKSALSQAVDLLPENSLVGLITFGTYIQVHEIGFSGGIPKNYVFRGSKEITKDQLMENLSFFPKKPIGSAGVIAGVRDGLSSQTISRFLMPASECEFVLDSLLEELQKDPWSVPADQRPARCTGTALSIAAHLLGACVPGNGARIMAFVGGPSTEGPGAIVSKTLSEPIRSHKDLDKDSVPYYHKAVKFYEGLSRQLVNQGHVLDLFACALDQVGVAELKVAVERTGGLVVLAESFGHSVFKDSLKHVFQVGEYELGLCSSGIFEVCCSKDIKIQGVLGPCASVEKKGPLCSETVIGQGNTSAWKLCGLDKATSLCIIFEIAKKDNPDGIGQSTSNQFYLQFLTYYQHKNGSMRFRVTTLSRRWISGPESTQDLIAGFDQEAAVATMARLVSYKMETEAAFDPIRWLDKSLIQLCKRFGDYQKDVPSSFNLSPRLSIFPQFIFHLRRSQFVQVFNNSPDETAYFRMILNRENVPNSVVMIQPSLVSYSFHSAPEAALLDVAAVAVDKILLLDSYFTVVIFHGSTVAQWRKAGYQDHPDHKAFAQLLQAPKDDAETLIKERFPVPRLVICDQYGSQARFLLAKLNPSATYNSDSPAVAGGDILFTDDVSYEVFQDHLQRLTVS